MVWCEHSILEKQLHCVCKTCLNNNNLNAWGKELDLGYGFFWLVIWVLSFFKTQVLYKKI